MSINQIKKLAWLLLPLLFFVACGKEAEDKSTQTGSQNKKAIEWKMVATWPKSFPGLGTGANYVAELIHEMSGGRINVTVYGANELVGPFEVFDAVSQGKAELGYGASYYWKSKSKATQFFATVPFGLTAQEMNSWLYHGGGMKLWEELYARFNLVPGAAGNTGVQMGGWFNKEINSVDDLKGLKMRILGLSGEVLKRTGGIPVSLPGGEIFTSLETGAIFSSLQTGAIDATEWVGPYNDLEFGLFKVAKYYYYPGWHEPGTALETMINKTAFNALPDDLKSIVRNALRVANQNMLSEFTANNSKALQILVDEYGVNLRQYPQSVINALYKESNALMEKEAKKDAQFNKIYQSFKAFREKVIAWHNVSERAYLNTRAIASEQ